MSVTLGGKAIEASVLYNPNLKEANKNENSNKSEEVKVNKADLAIGKTSEGESILVLTKTSKDLSKTSKLEINGKPISIDFVENRKNTVSECVSGEFVSAIKSSKNMAANVVGVVLVDSAFISKKVNPKMVAWGGAIYGLSTAATTATKTYLCVKNSPIK